MDRFVESHAADVMAYRPFTITRTTPLAEVERVFARHDVHCLPVCQEGALLGIVTRLDLMKAFGPGTTLLPRGEVIRQPAESVMTRNPVSVRPDTRLTRVLQIMAETHCDILPVTIGALLLGIVARDNVLHALPRQVTARPGRARCN